MEDAPEFDAVLKHYGVLGMKWGVRRTQEQLDRARGEITKRKAKKKAVAAQRVADKSRPASEDATKANRAKRIAKNAGTDRLSNQELEQLVKRMNLEKQYSKLTDGPDTPPLRAFLKKWGDLEYKSATGGKPSPTQEAGKVIRKEIDKYRGKKK